MKSADLEIAMKVGMCGFLEICDSQILGHTFGGFKMFLTIKKL
jgi:hypothetical protein